MRQLPVTSSSVMAHFTCKCSLPHTAGVVTDISSYCMRDKIVKEALSQKRNLAGFNIQLSIILYVCSSDITWSQRTDEFDALLRSLGALYTRNNCLCTMFLKTSCLPYVGFLLQHNPGNKGTQNYTTYPVHLLHSCWLIWALAKLIMLLCTMHRTVDSFIYFFTLELH